MTEHTRFDGAYASANMPWSEPSDDVMTDAVDAITGLPVEQRREVWDDLARQFEQRAEHDVDVAMGHRDHRAVSRLAVKTSAPAVVYYVRFGDRVKIGYTRNLAQRVTAIPHDEVLATEPGGLEVEAERHMQFARLRMMGEWFRLEEPLISHIARL